MFISIKNICSLKKNTHDLRQSINNKMRTQTTSTTNISISTQIKELENQLNIAKQKNPNADLSDLENTIKQLKNQITS